MRKLVTVKKIDSIEEIATADRLEIARIGGWQVVVPKGMYEAGEDVVYFEIDSIIPEQAGLEYLFGDKDSYHVKSSKMRGVLSQGIIAKLSIKPELANFEYDTDYSDLFGVTKYEASIASKDGGIKTKPFPFWLSKTDEIRYQSLIADYDIDIVPEDWMAFEKIDGTSFSCWCDEEGIGVAGRNQAFEDTDNNSYWNAFRAIKVGDKQLADWLREIYNTYGRVALQGEMFGEGIQKNRIKMQGVHVRFFNLFINGQQITYELVKKMYPDLISIWVPVHDVELTTDTDTNIELSKRTTMMNDSGADIEGLVWRHKDSISIKPNCNIDYAKVPEDKRVEFMIKANTPIRASFKIINNNYLLKIGE